MTEEAYLPASGHQNNEDTQHHGEAHPGAEAGQREAEVELEAHHEEWEDRDSYHERTSGSYTDSYEEGSLAGYRIPYRLMRERESPPPQPTHAAPGLPHNYRKYGRTILVETSEARPSLVSTVCVQPDKWRQGGQPSPCW